MLSHWLLTRSYKLILTNPVTNTCKPAVNATNFCLWTTQDKNSSLADFAHIYPILTNPVTEGDHMLSESYGDMAQYVITFREHTAD